MELRKAIYSLTLVGINGGSFLLALGLKDHFWFKNLAERNQEFSEFFLRASDTSLSSVAVGAAVFSASYATLYLASRKFKKYMKDSLY